MSQKFRLLVPALLLVFILVHARAEELSASSPYGEATVTRGIPYVTNPAARQNFDLFLPKNKSAQPFPLVVWIHGGAWMSGSFGAKAAVVGD